MPDAEERKARLPRGAYTQIARRLRPKVSPQHVAGVDAGEKQSRRVAAALARFRERMASEAEDYPDLAA